MVNNALSQLVCKNRALTGRLRLFERSELVVHCQHEPPDVFDDEKAMTDGQQTAWSRETRSHRHSCGRGIDTPRERKVSLRGGDANTNTRTSVEEAPQNFRQIDGGTGNACNESMVGGVWQASSRQIDNAKVVVILKTSHRAAAEKSN